MRREKDLKRSHPFGTLGEQNKFYAKLERNFPCVLQHIPHLYPAKTVKGYDFWRIKNGLISLYNLEDYT